MFEHFLFFIRFTYFCVPQDSPRSILYPLITIICQVCPVLSHAASVQMITEKTNKKRNNMKDTKRIYKKNHHKAYKRWSSSKNIVSYNRSSLQQTINLKNLNCLFFSIPILFLSWSLVSIFIIVLWIKFSCKQSSTNTYTNSVSRNTW